MAIRSKFSETLTFSVAVGEEGLKKIYSLLSNRIGPVEVAAECEDRTDRNFGDLRDLFAYENPPRKRVRDLTFFAQSTEGDKSARVGFHDHWYRRGIRIEIEARDDVVGRLSQELRDICQGFKTWYSFLNRLDLGDTSVAVFALMYFGFLAGVAFRWIPSSNREVVLTSYHRAVGILALVAFLFVYGSIFYGLSRLRRRIFAPVVYLIGQERAAEKAMENWRWVAVVGLAISFTGSALTLLL